MIYVKRTVKVISFLMGLILLLLLASAVFIPKNNQQEAGMEEISANGILGETRNSVDVLILGDSESYSSFSPMEIWKDTGYTAYVCGSSAQTLDYSLTLLERAMDKQSPKIVILETLTITRDIFELNAIGSKIANIFPIFNYHDRWKSLKIKDIFSTPNYTWTDDKKGYYYDTTIKGVEPSDYMSVTEDVEKLSTVNIGLVKSIQELCEENGAKLVLISTPSTVNWNYKRHNAIAALASEIGCEYIDMNLKNDVIAIDWLNDTRDKGDHLNHYGAVKATKYLSAYLMQTELLTDHRNDNAYRHWNDALARYLEMVSNS